MFYDEPVRTSEFTKPKSRGEILIQEIETAVLIVLLITAVGVIAAELAPRVLT